MNDIILSLLSSFIHGTVPALPRDTDEGRLIACAQAQNILPVIAYMNKAHPFIEDGALSDRLDRLLYQYIFANAGRYGAFDVLSKKLTDANIPHMPVKGRYLRELYPVPELRTFGDIDILIHNEDRARTDALMCALGYECTQGWEPTYSYKKDAELYEMHTNLMDGDLDGRSDLREYFARAWEHCAPECGLCFRPNDEFHFIYTLCHLAKHLYGGGAGIRMYLDAALYTDRLGDRLDWVHIASEFESLGLSTFYSTVMNASAAWFGVDTSAANTGATDPAVLAQLLEYTLSSDLFAKSRDRSAVELRNSPTGSKAGLMLKKLFPSAAEIEPRYTFLKGRRWLLPAAWAVRLFSNLGRIGRKRNELAGISNANISDVAEYDSFMKRVGL